MNRSLIEERSGVDAGAIAARQAEIAGKPQRVEEAPFASLSADSLELINRLRASAGAGPATEADMPGYFLTMIKHPGIFRGQFELGATLFKGAIPAREREIAVLRIGWLMRAPYEWGQHVDIAKRVGMSQDEIARVIDGAGAPGWSAHEAAVLRAVDELLSAQSICDETWAVLAKSWNEQQLIEFPMMVGQYVATAMVQNALRIRLAPSNPGLTHR